MAESRVSKGRYGEPHLTVKVAGVDDVMRLAIVLIHAQVEFCEIGQRTLRSLRRSLGAKNFDSYLARLVDRDSDQFTLIQRYSR